MMCSYASTLPDHIGRLYPHVQDGDIEEHSQSQRKMFLSRRAEVPFAGRFALQAMLDEEMS